MRTSNVCAVLAASVAAACGAATATAQGPTTAAERATSWATHQAMERDSYFRALAWRADGPVKTGARVEAIAIPRGNTGTIYVGVGGGNVWKTVNNGITWRPIFEHESAFAIGDVAVSPSNSQVVWVGTGEAQPRFSGYDYPGTGVFKSVDRGASWTPMGLDDTQHIGKVLIHPTDPDIVYVAAIGHQWSPNAERGVFRTRDGGAHWQKVLFINDSTGVIDLAMDPQDPRTLYAWAWQIEQGRQGGLFKSTDGGDHWRHISAGLPTGLLGRANIGVAPGDPNVVYLFLDNRGPTTVPGRPYVGGEVYRSDDRGDHWRKANTQDLYDVFGVFGWKFADVHVDPRSADHVYILGNHAFQS
ncbi:MAG: WD40/YVTN/BNR-like repeat-containing protein, partial [Gemmatimonadaceae bacterium]